MSAVVIDDILCVIGSLSDVAIVSELHPEVAWPSHGLPELGSLGLMGWAHVYETFGG